MTEYKMTAEAVEKLQEVLDFITAHRDRHDQGNWIRVDKPVRHLEPAEAAQCGTSGCVAGWLTMFSNRIPENAWRYMGEYRGHHWWEPDFSVFNPEEEAKGILGAMWVDADGVLHNDNDRGLELRYELNDLFSGDNTLAHLWYLAQDITGGRLKVPAHITPDPYNSTEYDEGDDSDW